MKSFFVTFGKGILYFIGLPFIILFLVLYGLYMLGVFFYMLFKTIVLFFEGKPTGIKDVLDDKALAILRDRKSKAIQEQALSMQPVTQNNINQTINNYNIGNTVPPQMNQGMPIQQELPPIDTTMRKAAPIDMQSTSDEQTRIPIINRSEDEK